MGEKLTRRHFLRALGLAGFNGLAASRAALAALAKLAFENGERPLVRYPQKRPLIRLTSRPPQLETPFSVFDESPLTPNDAFFVRYHLAGIPLEIDPRAFRLSVKGAVAAPLQLTLEELKSQFEPIEIVAVNQCSGNGRGFSEPRVGGGQMGNGAMGNARWRGVRLKDVLAKAGLASSARQISFRGLDEPVNPKTPAFVKALDVGHAANGEVMLAYAMNGADLPHLNGYPLRLVVPGYYGTYWVKHVSEIIALEQPFSGFWMDTAYRIPDNDCACVPAGESAAKTVPINRLNVRSFITNLKMGDRLKRGRVAVIRGIAFDGGTGISSVQVSVDGGQTWMEARLGENLGKYSFRPWTFPWTPKEAGPRDLMAKATSLEGKTQPLKPLWNPAGYMRNAIETVRISVA